MLHWDTCLSSVVIVGPYLLHSYDISHGIYHKIKGWVILVSQYRGMICLDVDMTRHSSRFFFWLELIPRRMDN